MELFIGLVIVAAAGYIAYKHFNKEKPNGTHFLDGATQKPEQAPVVEATVVPAESAVAAEPAPVVEVKTEEKPKKAKAPAKPKAAKTAKTTTAKAKAPAAKKPRAKKSKTAE